MARIDKWWFRARAYVRYQTGRFILVGNDWNEVATKADELREAARKRRAMNA